MENTLEKSFINSQLGIKLKSYIDDQCRVWFKAKEVAQILGYQDTNQAIRKHVSENHKRKVILNQPVETTGCSMTYFIDEPGFYELVFRSRLPTAKMFREWVFSNVLPTIRKYGYYRIIDTRIKQRVIIDGVKYYKRQVFSKYAASKNGEVINVKTKKKIKMTKCNGYLYFNIYDEKLEKRKNYYQHRFVFEVFRGPIPRFFEVDHLNNVMSDNRIKNLQLLTHKQNVGKSKNKPIISINIDNGKEKRYNSIQVASIKLNIHCSFISNICCKRKSFKSAASKKDGNKYTFKFLD